MSAWARIGWLVWVAWVLLLGYTGVRMLAYPYGVPPRMAYAIVGLSLLVLALIALPSLRVLRTAAPPTALALVSGLSGVVALGALVSVWLGFNWHFIGHATPKPPCFITDVLAAGQFDSVLAYAHRLSYDSATHNVPDSALITDTVGGFHITKAWIAPAVGANFIPHHDLEGSGCGKGRVVARIRVDTTYASRGYPPLQLPAGVSYVWVDSLALYDTTGTFRALIIPDSPAGNVVRFPVSSYSKYYRSRHAFANFPMGRWVLFHSHCTNVSCGNGCCQSCPPS